MQTAPILVVEDDDSIRRVLVEYLRNQVELHVDGARDGVEALHRLTSDSYSVVVLDMMMPKMSGIDFLSSLEAMCTDNSVKSLPRVPAVVVVTGATPEEIPEGSIERRYPRLVRAVFRKPVEHSRLADLIKRHVAAPAGH